MARIYPSLEEIRTLNPPPEPGELHLLEVLSVLLDDSCEIYFQPFLNGDRPDIVIIRENHGVFIVEVKDWNLDRYEVDRRKKWHVKYNNALAKSPLEQVLRYKKNLYNLHIEKLLEKKLKDYRYWKLTGCGVYFHNATIASINQKLVEPFKDDKWWVDHLNYDVELLGRDSLEEATLIKVLSKKYILGTKPSFLFDNALYRSFIRYLQPIIHSQDEGVHLQLTREQLRLAVSAPNISQRLKGVVGSGKTTLIAVRAVNALRRHGQRVLILCYNITLRNYIHDKISKVRAEFDWNKFYITNYHNFISAEMNNAGIQFERPANFDEFSQAQKSEFFELNYFSNPDLFSEHQVGLTKYNTIIIDEIQDYPRLWMDMVKKNFLVPDGEYLIVGDEKQNIFDRPIKNKDLVANVIGGPSRLSKCFRLDPELQTLAASFQVKYFTEKYEVDDFVATTIEEPIEANTLGLSHHSSACIKYLFSPKANPATPTSLYETVKQHTIELDEHPNNTTVLGFRISILREFDCFYRYKTGEQTNPMFETQEVWYRLFLDAFRSQAIIQQGLDLITKSISLDEKKNRLAVLLAVTDLALNTHDPIFENQRQQKLNSYGVNGAEFEKWFANNQLATLLNRDKGASLRQLEKNYPEYRKLTTAIKQVRDNKKANFWYERGTMKLSTIHNFKGWETRTLFLVLEEQFDDSDFQGSFEELIYTALTRSQRNLIVLNYGNRLHHEAMADLFAKYQ